MGVVAQDLKQAIVVEIAALSDEEKTQQLAVHTAVADAIRTYLLENLEALGTYVGVLSGSPPPSDPANGQYDWKVSTMTLTGAQLVAGSSSFETWVATLETAIKTVTFVGVDTSSTITTTVSALLADYDLSSLTPAAMGQTTSHETAWVTIATHIVDALLVTLPVPEEVAATSTSPGTGVVLWDGLN